MLTSTHLFAGGGGDARGFDQAGFTVTYGANHDGPAVDTLRANWPKATAEQADINLLQMWALPDTDVLAGSPICTEATPASGLATPRRQLTIDDELGTEERPSPREWVATRKTALDLTRAVEAKRYRAVVCENVPQFATRWELFDWWLNGFEILGYRPHLVSASSAHLDGDGFAPVPQDRHRLIVVLVRKDQPDPDLRVTPRSICATCGEVRGVQQWKRGGWHVGTYQANYRYVCPNRRCGHAEVQPTVTPIADVLDLDTPGRRIADGHPRTGKPYVDNTRARIRDGIRRHGGRPFITVMRNHCTTLPLTAPLSTVTVSGNHHYLTVPGPDGTVDGCLHRKLTVRERARVQGFPDHHVLCGNDTAVSRQIGNAVPVNAARWAAERVREVLT